MAAFSSMLTVDAIAARTEPVLRNLRITQCYFELSRAMSARLGVCANWCTFATWASKQAGQTIRKEDLRRALEQVLLPEPATGRGLEDEWPESERGTAGLQEQIRQLLDPVAIMERSSDAVSRGNRKVFAEIGREFSRFLEELGADTAYDADRLNWFCTGLRPGDPPDGQQFLRQAFTRYYQAFFEQDAKVKAELVLLANIEIGFHEQTRLQPEIAEALNASVADPGPLLRQLLGRLFPRWSWLMYPGFRLMRWFGKPLHLDTTLGGLLEAARRQVRLFFTRHMMTLGLPEHVRLRLGEDLHAAFPPSLQQLNNPDLNTLLRRVDPTPGRLQGSGAIDWADLPDRLHFIVDLFRCYQETPALLEPPFSPEQTAAIQADLVPESGEL